MERNDTTFHDQATESGILRRVQAANAIAQSLGDQLVDASLDAIASDIGYQIGALDPRDRGERFTGKSIPVTDQSEKSESVPVHVSAA